MYSKSENWTLLAITPGGNWTLHTDKIVQKRIFISDCFSIDHNANLNLINIIKVDMSVEVNIYSKKNPDWSRKSTSYTCSQSWRNTRQEASMISVVLNILACYTVVLRWFSKEFRVIVRDSILQWQKYIFSCWAPDLALVNVVSAKYEAPTNLQETNILLKSIKNILLLS